MEDVILLQVGDVHFPDIDLEKIPIHQKEIGFPSSMKKTLPDASYMIILQDFLEEIDTNPSAILLAGDLTTGGEIDSYEKCLQFFKERIPKYFFTADFQRVFIVPGNHDLVREKTSEDSVSEKFNPMLECISRQCFPDLPVPSVKFGLIKQNKSNILIVSLNSCIGCGEIRHFPDEIKETVKEIFEKIINDKDRKSMEKLCNELDTPSIDDKDIKKTIKYISQQEEDCLPILLSHHNLLPQRALRVVRYSELLNGGLLRDQLMTLDKPILFLHGHLHDDPIEIIRSPGYENAKIICISAPLFFPNKENKTENIGFNKVKIIFEGEVPIGCEIELHRLNGAKIDKRKQRIRFWGPPRTMALLNSREEKILSCINTENVYLSKIRVRYNEKSSDQITVDEVEKDIEKLSWLGLVDYKNRDGPKAMRYVTKVIP